LNVLFHYAAGPDLTARLDAIPGLTINCDLHPLLNRFDRQHTERGEVAEKRTPVLLAEEDFDEWLDATPSRAPIYFGTFGKDDLDADPAPSATRRATTIMPLDTTISEF